MRIRTIKPEWLDDEKLAAASDEARFASVGFILVADDHGRGRAHPMYLASQLWKYSLAEPSKTLAKVSRVIRELVEIGFLREYEVAGQAYFQVVNWSKHQRVDKPSAPRIPAPPTTTEELLANISRDPPESLAPDLGPRSTDLGPRPRSTDPSAPADAGRVFSMWVEVFNLDAARTKLTPKRATAIRARLKRFSADDLVTAIRAFAADPWRHEQAVRHELATLLRDDERIEGALRATGPGMQPVRDFGPENIFDTSDLEPRKAAASA